MDSRRLTGCCGEIKGPQKWEKVVCLHLFLKEHRNLGGKSPRGPLVFGALLSRGIEEQSVVISVCSRRGSLRGRGGVALAGGGSPISGPSLAERDGNREPGLEWRPP